MGGFTNCKHFWDGFPNMRCMAIVCLMNDGKVSGYPCWFIRWTEAVTKLINCIQVSSGRSVMASLGQMAWVSLLHYLSNGGGICIEGSILLWMLGTYTENGLTFDHSFTLFEKTFSSNYVNFLSNLTRSLAGGRKLWVGLLPYKFWFPLV